MPSDEISQTADLFLTTNQESLMTPYAGYPAPAPSAPGRRGALGSSAGCFGLTLS